MLRDYVCGSCGHAFEENLPYNAKYEPIACATCKAPTAFPIPSGFGSYKIKGKNDASTSPKSTTKKK